MNISWLHKKQVWLISLLSIGVITAGIIYYLLVPLTVAVDGELIETRVLGAQTVEQVLEKEHILWEEADAIEPGLDTRVTKGIHIVIQRAFPVQVVAAGETREIVAPPVKVEEAIMMAGFEKSEQDLIKSIPTIYTIPGETIELIRVVKEELVLEETIPYVTERVSDHSLERGLSRTVTAGRAGLVKREIKVTYHNGEEVRRVEMNREVIREPVNRVLAQGTITSVSRGSQRLDFREAKYMVASAYTYTGRNTATGIKPHVGVVAVDPNIIPLGTRLYVEGYGYGRAADTGGSIIGNQIDIFMEERNQCLSWGRRTVKVYILH